MFAALASLLTAQTTSITFLHLYTPQRHIMMPPRGRMAASDFQAAHTWC